MSDSLTRRIDEVAAWARLAALLGVVLAALVEFPHRADLPLWTIARTTLTVALVDVAPLVMLRLGFYPDAAALAFGVFDGLYALTMLYLGGEGMFFYCFVPVLILSVRFDLTVGLLAGGALTAGQVVVAALRNGFGGTEDVLSPALFRSLELMLVSLLASFLAYYLKQEPPLRNLDATRLRQEVTRLRGATDRARAIYEMALMLGATLNPRRILDALLEISAVGFEELLGGDEDPMRVREQPASAVLLFGKDGLYVAASRGIHPPEARQTVSADAGVLYEAVSHGKPVIVDSLAVDPSLRKFTPFRRCHSAICIPLSAGFEIYGVVVFASNKPRAFDDEHAEVLRAVANQGAVALNNAQLYEDLRREKERILAVGEQERGKLARDLHDGPTQSMSAIAMRLNYARLMIDHDPERVKTELFRLENLARRTTKEIRTMLFTLRPVVLETQGIKVAVEQLVERLHETCELPVTLQIDEELCEQVDPNLQAVAWSITEEALTNARKHSNGDQVWVRMRVEDSHFITEIEDNGIGFDYAATMAGIGEHDSFGLLNYHERAALVNGRVTVRTAPGQGTTVRLVVPLQQDIA